MNERNRFPRVLASAILWAALAGETPAQMEPRPAAVVNGEAIALAEVETILKQRAPITAQATPAQRRQLQQDVLDCLIDDRLLEQYLLAHGPQVEEAEITQWFAQLEKSLKSESHTLQDFYRERGLTEKQLRRSVTCMFQWVRYLSQRLTEAELQRYYEENRDYFDEVTVRASHILLKVPAGASEKERQAAGDRLRALRGEILARKLDFAEAARKSSQCPSASQGGDVGYLPRKFDDEAFLKKALSSKLDERDMTRLNDGVRSINKYGMEEAFLKSAFSLKVGELSAVVQTSHGLHLIKAVDRKSGERTTYEQIKEEVQRTAAEELRRTLVAQLHTNARIEVFLPNKPETSPGR